MRLNRRGVDLCPRCTGGNNHAAGKSQIENTYKESNHIRRSRACADCGHTWSTAEISLPEFRKMTKIIEGIKKVMRA